MVLTVLHLIKRTHIKSKYLKPDTSVKKIKKTVVSFRYFRTDKVNVLYSNVFSEMILRKLNKFCSNP